MIHRFNYPPLIAINIITGRLFVKSCRKRAGFKEVEKGLFHFSNISFCIDAGAKRTFVQNADDWNGIGILNSACQVQFAGYGHNGLRSILHNDSPCQRPSGGYRNLHLVLVCQFDQVLDFAFPTSLTVFDISSDPDLAIKILDAMRKQKKKPVGPCPMMV